VCHHGKRGACLDPHRRPARQRLVRGVDDLSKTVNDDPRRSQVLAPYLHRYRRFCDAFSSVASNDVLIDVNPLKGAATHARQGDGRPSRKIRRAELPSPSESTKEKRVLRADEIRRLIGATLPTYSTIVTLLAWSGLRVSEAIALRWRDVDFVDGFFCVRGQLPPLKPGEAPWIAPTKSRRGLREMPFLPVVEDALTKQLAAEIQPLAEGLTTSSS
jgi:integrase